MRSWNHCSRLFLVTSYFPINTSFHPFYIFNLLSENSKTDSKAFPDLVSQLEKLVGNFGLNLLINNAGYKESELRDLESVTEELMVKHFKVNCVAPLILTRLDSNLVT